MKAVWWVNTSRVYWCQLIWTDLDIKQQLFLCYLSRVTKEVRMKQSRWSHQRHNEHFSRKTQMIQEHVKVPFDSLDIVVHFCSRHQTNACITEHRDQCDKSSV